MTYRWTSSKTILSRVKRLLDSDEWEGMARIYLADAIQMIGLNHSTTYKATKGNDLNQSDKCLVDVENHLADFPSDLEMLVKIECNGVRLAWNKDVAIHGLNSCDDYVWGKAYDSCENYYSIDGGRIRTSFESGKIKLFYKKFDCDHEGFIMIPDVPEFKEALVWKVFANLMLEGYRPKLSNMSYQEADDRAESKKSAARSRMKQMSRDQRRALSEMLTSTNISNTESHLMTD